MSETTTRDITLKIELPEIDDLNYRDEFDQVAFYIYRALHDLHSLLDHIVETGDVLHWPEGSLIAAETGLLQADQARRSFLESRYSKALVEAEVASWQV